MRCALASPAAPAVAACHRHLTYTLSRMPRRLPLMLLLLPLVAGISSAPSAAVAAQFGTLTSTIVAPADVEVGDAFKVTTTVQQTGDTAFALDVDLAEGTTCPPEAGGGEQRLVIGQTVDNGTRSFDARLPDTLEIGEYVVCAYLVSLDLPTRRFTDQAAVEIRPVEPTEDRPWLLASSRYFSTYLGPLDLQKLSLPDARFYYGRESTLRRVYGACRVHWSDLGMTTSFWNLGGGSTSCGVDGRINDVVIGGERMYGLVHTASRLWLGDPASKIRRVYRRAKRVGGSKRRWLLKPYFSPIADGFPTSPIIAVVRNGTVHQFIAAVGAAGE